MICGYFTFIPWYFFSEVRLNRFVGSFRYSASWIQHKQKQRDSQAVRRVTRRNRMLPMRDRKRGDFSAVEEV